MLMANSIQGPLTEDGLRERGGYPGGSGLSVGDQGRPDGGNSGSGAGPSVAGHRMALRRVARRRQDKVL